MRKSSPLRYVVLLSSVLCGTFLGHWYASPCLWNQFPVSLCQLRTSLGTSNSSLPTPVTSQVDDLLVWLLQWLHVRKSNCFAVCNGKRVALTGLLIPPEYRITRFVNECTKCLLRLWFSVSESQQTSQHQSVLVLVYDNFVTTAVYVEPRTRATFGGEHGFLRWNW